MSQTFGQQLIGLLPNLRRFALSLTRSAAAADDLVQITCEKALANASSYADGTRLDAWLFRIMRNAWIDQLRKEKTAGLSVDVDALVNMPGDDGARQTESVLMLRATRAAIADLPDEQREVLVLVCIEELSYQETSDVLRIPIGTVMSRLARARKKLASVMGIIADE
ncbi:MAG: RNA polymerase sigma factor [Roseitalea sp.]|jgi:RNA polymerase sigma-70 factor (ECF subfamily)|uniref:RNA polymerase sigma factor n=1 Tax=Oceaniradius stylonematis TaxID=2184161 RepID=UPI001B00A17D|nr:RNA polymerase sigma factor [Oceaniradius stylonematis]MBO6554848.1 RNA polymerase sigma factor [Roseitalea sp.]MBO6953846.1 RNA polymerase sigma factor [Rhizobiaceae bacterium]MCR9194791.1 RNA polymerase sigma factor [Hyphomonas sp.]MBO6614077.1 RNA polymerase sigma factor [Roseitalea sp.]MBO6673414.1 RNA polymerase sigma factor [Roseitalea sp.]